MLSKPHRRFLKCGVAALSLCLLAAPVSYAQDRSSSADGGAALPGGSSGGASQAGSGVSAAEQSAGRTGVSDFVGSLIPGFAFGATVNLSETYATNSLGGNISRPDWITLAGLSLTMNEHSARVSFDASYSGAANFYADGTQSTQFTNDLQAATAVIVIPDYVNFNARAFAQPVVISNLGAVTANGNIGSNGYRNSFGFSGGPDITFHLGDFATSVTSGNYGATYFTEPSGTSSSFTGIPGVGGPQDTTMRSFSERLSSGTDFVRLNWTATATLQEMDRPQGLFSEKVGVAHFQYAITRAISLIGTGGYDAIHNTVSLSSDLSGPIGTGGLALTLGEDFQLQFEVGEKYRDISYQGSLRWNIAPTAVLTGEVSDSISTPEGQLLNSLSGLVSTANGGLASSADLYSNGTASSLSSFNAQQSGSFSYDQNIARYQRVNLDYSQDFGREHATLDVYAMRQTVLDKVFIGQRVNNSWGMNARLSHDISRLMTASVGGGYSNYEELGGHAQVYTANAQLSYTLSPDTNVYFSTEYLTRDSSSSLQNLSPFTGNVDDLRFTLGLSHRL